MVNVKNSLLSKIRQKAISYVLIILAVLLYGNGNLCAQLLSTNINNYYDFNGTGPLTTAGSYTVNANNDSLIDLWDTYHNDWSRGAKLYIPTDVSEYSNKNTENEIKFVEFLHPTDYNNDGLLDFLFIDRFSDNKICYIYTRNYKGEYIKVKQTLMTPAQYAGQRSDLILDSYVNPLDQPGMSMVGSTVYGKVEESFMQSIDLNGDGLSDFYNDKTGEMFMTTQNGILITGSLGGNITVRDFDGNGLMDYTYYNKDTYTTTLHLLNKDGSATEQVLLDKIKTEGRIWCYDFDHDNDVDIMIPVDSYNGMSIVLIIENKGDGTFKKHEIGLDGQLWFKQVVDYNADGKYELLAVRYTSETDNGTNLVAYIIDGMKIDDSYQFIAHNIYNHDLLVADYDLEGTPEIVYNSRTGNYSNKYISAAIPGAQQNTAPNRPDAPTIFYDASSGLLRVDWKPSMDKESTAADLSYALRIGTEDGCGNMVYAHARKDGTRKNLKDGNCGFSTRRTMDVKSWPAGDYYISVQAVDALHRGSAFSKIVVFHKPEASADFLLSYPLIGFGVGDTCRVTLRTPKESGCTYKWNLADGVILNEADKDADMYIVFPTGGSKNISLYVTTSDGVVSIMNKTVEVAGVNLRHSLSDFFFSLCIDLDGNGFTEITKGEQFYQGDKDGNYKTINKLWNASLPKLDKGVIADFNKDGYPDILSPRYAIINDGDMQMNVQNNDAYINNIHDCLLDVDNDGDLDDIEFGSTFMGSTDYGYIIENTDGNYTTWLSHKRINGVLNPKLIDYNRDGLNDLYCDNGIYLNNGDMTFTTIGNTMAFNARTQQIIDIDGDGNWDKVYSYDYSGFGVSFYGEKIDIEWGDGTTQEIICPDGSPFSNSPLIYDIDNNGCLDIVVELSTPKRWRAIYYFNQDHSYILKIYNFGDFYYSINETEYTRTDGIKMLGNVALSGRSNSRPAAPTALRSTQNEKFVVIEWNHSEDKETPAALMRYNISIKRKGATGENAYFISPLNMDNDEIELPAPIHLIEANKFSIPINKIPSGEYEVKVQGLDRWHSQSKFSETYMLTVLEQSVIDMPATVTVGVPVMVKIIGNSDAMPDFGKGASVAKIDENSYKVTWNTVGMKTVKIGTLAEQGVYVQDKPAGNFTIPASVLKGAKVVVSGNDMLHGQWEVSKDGGDFVLLSENRDLTFCDGKTNGQVTMTFGKTGHYELRHTVANDDTSCYYTAEVDVADGTPAISFVSIDEASGYYRINWEHTTMMPADVEMIYIYKETSKSNEYALLDSIAKTQTYYIDKYSIPSIKAERYVIAYKLTYGESAMSVAHQSIHTMINKGLGNAFNLSWSKYEGRDVESYRILGGTSAANLQEIDIVSGNITSYSTKKTGEHKYYAVEVVMASAKGVGTRASTSVTPRSNVVSVDDAIDVIPAEEVVVRSTTGSTFVGRNVKTLQLRANIYPVATTIQRVNWTITEGKEYASVNEYGVVSVNGVGPVTVIAQTVDGSNVSGEIKLTATNDREYLGDVNMDYTVTVGDVVVMGNYILMKYPETFCFDSGDINADGRISMSDVVSTINIVLDYNTISEEEIGEATRAGMQDNLNVGNAVETDENIIIPVSMDNAQEYSAFQMDIKMPQGLHMISAKLTPRAGDTHTVTWRKLGNGDVRIVVYSPKNEVFSGDSGDMINLYFTTAKGVTSIEKDIWVKNVILVTSEGEEIHVGNTTAILDISESGLKVYTVDNKLYIESNRQTSIPLYDIKGYMVDMLSVEIGKNVYKNLSSGVYLINRNKVIIK